MSRERTHSRSGMWDPPIPQVLRPSAVGNHEQEGIALASPPPLPQGPRSSGHSHTGGFTSRHGTGPNLPQTLLHPLASPSHGQGQSRARAGERDLGSALPQLPGLRHTAVPGSTRRPHAGDSWDLHPTVPAVGDASRVRVGGSLLLTGAGMCPALEGSIPRTGRVPRTGSTPCVGNSPVLLDSSDLLCPASLAAPRPSRGGRKVSLAQAGTPRAGAGLQTRGRIWPAKCRPPPRLPPC